MGGGGGGLQLNHVSKTGPGVGFKRYIIISKYVWYDTSKELYTRFVPRCGLVVFSYFIYFINILQCIIIRF